MNKLNNETAKWITANTECDQTQLFSIRIVIKKKKKLETKCERDYSV